MSLDEFLSALSSLAESAGTRAVSYASSMSPLGGLLRTGYNLGYSGRQMLAAYREAGFRISNDTFWNVSRSVLTTIGNVTGVGTPVNLLLRAIPTLPGGKSGSYEVNYLLHNLTIGPNGEREYSTSTFTVRQNELDIDKANQAVSSIVGNMNKAGDEYPNTIAFELTSVIQRTG